MDITPYVDNLRRDLVAAAETGSDEVKAAAERLALALEPATRLALMEALSAAADEVTTELPSGSVDVRLDGRDLKFVLTSAAPVPPPAPPPPPPLPEPEGDDSLSRITLRIPESVKARAEEAAAKAGTSLNTWLVNVVRAATSDHAVKVDIDLSSLPFPGVDPFRDPGRRPGRRMTGWI